MRTLLRGLTWDHARGRAVQHVDAPGVATDWDVRPLSAFESGPLTAAAQRHDLLVIDHPVIGERGDALVPLEEVFGAAELASWRAQCVAPSWESYVVDGRTWALPLDLATQAIAYRADLMSAPPRTWTAVVETAHSVPTALCLAGPHAGLTLLAMAGRRGRSEDEPLLVHDRAVMALAVLQQLWRLVDREASLADPIGIHELLRTGDSIAWCPLVYSYATYGAGEGRRVSWADAPALFPGEEPGSTLGGAGLALSTRSLNRVHAVRSWIRRLVDPAVQRDVVCVAGGQPALRTVWESADVDAEVNHHYRSTGTSVRTAYLRPRHPGWPAFQSELGERVRAAIETRADPDRLVRDVEAAYRSARARSDVEVG